MQVLRDISPSNVTDDLLLSSEPLVLKDFAKEWDIVQSSKINDEKVLKCLRGFYSGEPIKACYVDVQADGRVFYNDDLTAFNFQTKKKDFNEVAEELLRGELKSSPTIYISSTEVDRYFPQLRTDCAIPHKLTEGLVNLWVGGRSRIAAHYDVAHNLAVCLSGKRRFTLFPPAEVKNLYPGPLHFSPGGRQISLVDFKCPDFKKYPNFKNALKSSMVVDLEPGDALILPGLWWHHVEGL